MDTWDVLDALVCELRKNNQMPPTKEVEIFDAASLDKFVATAMPGDPCVYHVGNLAIDISGEVSPLPRPERESLAKLSSMAFALFRGGYVHLVQRREGDVFAYLAVRSSRFRERFGGVGVGTNGGA